MGHEKTTGCTKLRRLIIEGQPPGPADREHLASCTPCAQLAADNARLARLLSQAEQDDQGEMQPDPPMSFDSVLGPALARESHGAQAWLRERPTSVRVALAVLTAMAMVAVGLSAPRVDLGLYPRLRLMAELVALGLLTLATIWVWLRPLHLPSRPVLVVATLGLALLLPTALAVLPVAHQAHPASVGGVGSEMFAKALPCFIYGMVLAVPVMILTLLLGRHLGPAHRGLLAVGTGSLAGVTALHLHCPITAQPHLLAAHASIPLFLGLAYLAIALTRRVMRASNARA